MAIAESRAPARTALAGNPSDGFGGAVLALALDRMAAHAQAEPAEALAAVPESDLVRAAAARLARELGRPEIGRSSIRWRTAIPRSVGLGGSSAIVIATLRALGELHDAPLDRVTLARLALAVETEELGIAAGLQDRIAQSFGGLTFMEFAGPGTFEPLDPALLPPLVIAWQAESAASSGAVHGDLRERHSRGDAVVIAAVEELAEAAREARAALLDRDEEGFAQAVDATFDVRHRLLGLDPRHVAMVRCARAEGAAANYTGSGGAIVAVCRNDAHRASVTAALARAGCECG